MIHQLSNSTIQMDKFYSTGKMMVNGASERNEKNSDTVSFKNTVKNYVSYTRAGVLTEKPESRFYPLGAMVGSLLSEQGLTLSDAINGKPYVIDEKTQTEAAELVSDNGYWSVENTSDRIVEFAINISGDDTSKLNDIKAAIDKGFQMALDSFGGTLPEISYSTYDAVIEKLDSWANDNKEEIS